MRVIHFSLLAICSLLVASAPAGPQAAGSSSLANLEELGSNFDLSARTTIQSSALDPADNLEKRGPDKTKKKSSSSDSKSKSKSTGKSSGKSKDKGAGPLDGKQAYELVSAAATARGDKIGGNQLYLLREDVGQKSYLLLVKADNRKGNNNQMEVVKASQLIKHDVKDGSPDLGQYRCKALYGQKTCKQHSFSYYECGKVRSAHVITKTAKLFFFKATDSMYGPEMYAYKTADETFIYDKCFKALGQRPTNTARKNNEWDEYYPGTWKDAKNPIFD